MQGFFVREAKFLEDLNFEQQQLDLATIVFRHCLEIAKASFQWVVTGRCVVMLEVISAYKYQGQAVSDVTPKC